MLIQFKEITLNKFNVRPISFSRIIMNDYNYYEEDNLFMKFCKVLFLLFLPNKRETKKPSLNA